MLKYRLKFTSKTDPNNTGYFIRKRKVGFTACSLKHPEMAKEFKTEADVEDVMQFMQEQGELDYYTFETETLGG